MFTCLTPDILPYPHQVVEASAAILFTDCHAHQPKFAQLRHLPQETDHHHHHHHHRQRDEVVCLGLK